MERRTLLSPAAPKPRDASSIDKRPARTSAGISSRGLGRAPRGPNRVLSSHSAVILASATIGLHVGSAFSASAKRLSAPNSVSANRRSISCCRQARTSSVLAQGAAALLGTQNLALIPMRLVARTTAGAQTAAAARPQRNCRRDRTSEPISRGSQASADGYTPPVAANPRPLRRRVHESRLAYSKQPQI